MHRALRLTIDRTALQANWRWLQDRAGVPAGAAVKADCYSLGARQTVKALYAVGCRDFLVSNWAEAKAPEPLPLSSSIVVLHGVGPKGVEAEFASTGRPVLNSPSP